MSIQEKRRYPENLQVHLTDAELLAVGREQAAALTRRNKHEEALNTFKAQIKADVGREEETIRKCTSMLESGMTWRDVECVEQHDFDRSVVTITRLDTGELVRERVMTEAERQMELPENEALAAILELFDTDEAKASTATEITVRLLEARDAARTLAGDDYAKNIDPIIETLRTASAERNPAAVVLDVARCEGDGDTCVCFRCGFENVREACYVACGKAALERVKS
jgi:hypothetical protein